MRRALLIGFVLLSSSIIPFRSIHALSIIADATGYDAGYVTDFWGVHFVSGEGYIESITVDLSATGGRFDYDGSPFLDPLVPGVEPIIGALDGLALSDIDFPRANGGPVGNLQVLTFSFSPSSFTSGDWFRFSGDVDGAGGSTTSSAGVFGELGAIFGVNMSTGESFESSFVRISDERSEAMIESAPVPEASTLYLLGSGLLGLVGFRRISRR